MLTQFLKALSLSALAILFSSLNPALAEQWIYIGISDDNTAHFLDFDTVRGSGSTRSFWVRTENSSGRVVSLSRLIVNCTERQGGLLEEIQYSYFGSGYVRRIENPYPRMQELAPGTMFSAYANFLCLRITTNPTPNVQPSTVSSIRAACGDPSPVRGGSYRLYPVFVNYSQSTLQDIRNNLCRDAFRMTRENGQNAIQVASFTSESRAYEFAQFLRDRFGSGEVGQANTIVRP